MTSNRRYSKLTIALLLVIFGCLEPYAPPDIITTIDLLVVDGFLNTTEKTAKVTLSHAVALTDERKPAAESNALVAIRTETGDAFTLTEGDSGRYTASGLAVDLTTRYQLYIRTQSNQEYISDYVVLKDTPPMDSVTWAPKDDGVDILINTHDATGNTRYYSWDYIETYEYHSSLLSAFTVINQQAIRREADEMVSVCWKTEESTVISIASTARLQADVVHNFPLIYLPRVSPELSAVYSVLVKQRAMEVAEYDFWKALRDVTEGLGGLFDSQPYQILGNVRNAKDATIPVLGYFSGGSVDQQRLFIDTDDLPDYLRKRPYHGCLYDSLCISPEQAPACGAYLTSLPDGSYIGNELLDPTSPYAYTYISNPRCADCRYGGGTLTRPAFWPP